MPVQPFLKGRSVFVEPVYNIKGDINYSVGNVDFKGSVKIEGSVRVRLLHQGDGKHRDKRSRRGLFP